MAGDDAAASETAVNEAIVACGGDARAAVRSLLITIDVYEKELQGLRREIDAMTAAVSRGYARRGRRAPAGDASR